MTDHDSTRETDGLPADAAFVCDDCGRRWYYTRGRCPDCQSDSVSTYQLTEGELIARTDIAVTPDDVRSPNPVGLVRFDDVQLIAQLADDSVSVGDRVAFAGAHRLRADDETEQPRLTPVE
jgi:uncharacterized OB-fold protein